jgi:two-component system OmpR family response regulator
MKALVIDDEEDVRFVASRALGRIGGMTVIEAGSGAEGVARAAAELPDVILLDVMMPGMDGAATFAALRANPLTASIPVVFLTAKAMLREIERLKKLGAHGVVLKPFDPTSLAQQVRELVGA